MPHQGLGAELRQGPAHRRLGSDAHLLASWPELRLARQRTGAELRQGPARRCLRAERWRPPGPGPPASALIRTSARGGAREQLGRRVAWKAGACACAGAEGAAGHAGGAAASASGPWPGGHRSQTDPDELRRQDAGGWIPGAVGTSPCRSSAPARCRASAQRRRPPEAPHAREATPPLASPAQKAGSLRIQPAPSPGIPGFLAKFPAVYAESFAPVPRPSQPLGADQGKPRIPHEQSRPRAPPSA